MSKCFQVALAFGLAAALGPNCALTSPTPDNTPVMKADDGPKRPGLPIEGVVTNPDWASRPTGEDVERFYPKLAALMSLPGRVLMQCVVSAVGEVDDCKVGKEAPLGLGFGAAALRMAPLFRMKPQTIDGAPVGGSVVDIPFNFAMDAAPPGSSAAPVEGVNSKAMALARRLAAAQRGMSDTAYADMYVAKIEEQVEGAAGSPDIDEAAHQAITDALKSACLAAIPRMTDSSAAVLAAVYSEEELARIVDFAESPAGLVWFSRQADVVSRLKSGTSTDWYDMLADAKSRFCAHRSCASSPKASPTPP